MPPKGARWADIGDSEEEEEKEEEEEEEEASPEPSTAPASAPPPHGFKLIYFPHFRSDCSFFSIN